MTGGLVPGAVVTDADVRTAQAVLDAWLGEIPEALAPVVEEQFGGALLRLRGLLTATLADVRAAGYLEGLMVGRREAGHLVQACLQDEGLL